MNNSTYKFIDNNLLNILDIYYDNFQKRGHGSLYLDIIENRVNMMYLIPVEMPTEIMPLFKKYKQCEIDNKPIIKDHQKDMHIIELSPIADDINISIPDTFIFIILKNRDIVTMVNEPYFLLFGLLDSYQVQGQQQSKNHFVFRAEIDKQISNQQISEEKHI